MSSFELYLKLGFQHIVDLNGYDHITFVISLCAGYNFTQIKKVLILITAFTIGHSVSLVLSTLKYILVPAPVIEFLIPVTILITAISNLFPVNKRKGIFVYFVTLFFGLIHGLGFSNYLKELLGKEISIIQPLFAFNVGLEIGQIFILSIYAFFLFFFIKVMKVKQEAWRIFVSGAALVIALILIIQNKFW